MNTMSPLHLFQRWQHQQQVKIFHISSRCYLIYWCAGSPVKPKGFAMSFIHASVRGRVDQERASRNPRQEFLDYINSPLDIGEHDPVKWWGVRYLSILRSNR
jgi:hypothetical protein